MKPVNLTLFKWLKYFKMKKTKTIDIVVPTFNNESYTVRCFESVRKNTNISYRIIWVDNGSTGKSRKIVLKELKKHKNYLSVWLPKNTGFIHATNLGLSYSTSDHIVLLNNDTEVIPDWLTTMKEIFDNNNNIGIVGPLASECDSWQSWKNVKAKLMVNLPDLTDKSNEEISTILAEQYPNHVQNVRMVAFFCAMFSKEVFDEVGYLPTCYNLGLGDDDEFCFNVKKYTNKRIVFTASTLCVHHHRTTFKTMFSDDKLKQIQHNNIALFKKRCY